MPEVFSNRASREPVGNTGLDPVQAVQGHRGEADQVPLLTGGLGQGTGGRKFLDVPLDGTGLDAETLGRTRVREGGVKEQVIDRCPIQLDVRLQGRRNQGFVALGCLDQAAGEGSLKSSRSTVWYCRSPSPPPMMLMRQ